MKFLIAAFFSICLSTTALAQDPHMVDSLENMLDISNNAVQKTLAVYTLAKEFRFTKPDSCLYYANIGLELIKDQAINEKIEKAGLSHYTEGLYECISIAFSEEGNDSIALRYISKAREMAEKSKDQAFLNRITEVEGEIYENIGEPGLAIPYIKTAINNVASKYMKEIYTGNLASCFYDEGEYDSALYYLKSIDSVIVYDDALNRPWPLNHYYLGNIYWKKHNFEQAMREFNIAQLFSEKSHLPYDLCQSYMGKAALFQNLNMVDSALWYAKRSLLLSKTISVPSLSLRASTFLSTVFESENKVDSAFKYLKISNGIKDSLFNKEKIKQVQNFAFNQKLKEQEIKEEKDALRNSIRTYSLSAGIIILLLFALIQNRNNRQKQKANLVLQKTLANLQSTQAQLIQSEKMASLGELTAGIAHEIQNPLNFVNNFSDLNNELITELRDEIANNNFDEVNLLAKDIQENEQKITHHGKRAEAIVKGMLQHSRSSGGIKELTDINALSDEYLRLSYHGLRAKDKNFHATLTTDFNKAIGQLNIVHQDIGRVLLNLYNNAFYAVNEKKKQYPEEYEPTVSVSTKETDNKIIITVKDNGNGIPQQVVEKIFQPFFTTKPTGHGTGLGLSLSYEIIKAHGGDIKVDTKEGEYTEFHIALPVP